MNEDGNFPASDSCNDTNDHNYMFNALMMQHQHHDQFGAGGYHINCDYRPVAAALSSGTVAPVPLPRLQSSVDHQYGAHLNVTGAVSSSSAGGFSILGGGIGTLAGGIQATPSHSSGSIPTYGGGIPAQISASSGGILPSQNGGVRGGGSNPGQTSGITTSASGAATPPSRYESQKRRDWNTFGQYLRNSRPPLPLARCNGEHVLQFLRYLDQFGKTKVHGPRCPYFGLPHPPHPCECPLRQAWGSLDALIGRLRAAFEEHGGKPESNPFGARQVRLYLREVREHQAKARGIAYEKKKRKRPKPGTTDTTSNFHSEG